ncbi:MAG: recombinase family protein [Actinomycetota bacterium]
MSNKNFNEIPEQRKRAVFYIRVSKDPDKDDPRFAKVSPETQIEKCRQKAIQEGWEAGPDFADIDVSHADLEHRTKWKECLEVLTSGDVLVVYEQTRVSRSRIYWENLYQDLKERDIALCLLNLNLDTTTPMGEFFLSMSWGLSQLEIDIMRARIMDGQDRSRNEGRRQGGPRIFGTESDPINGKGALRIVEEEARWVRFAFEKRAEGWSYSKIAKTLREEGVQGPGKLDKKTGKMKKGPISAYVISRWCKQPLYIGMSRGPKGEFPVNVEPIVSREHWDRVQTINAEKSREIAKRGDYLLSGLCRCSECGEVLIHHIRRNERTCWVCSMKQHSESPRYDHIPTEQRCKGVAIEEHVLERYVLDEFFKHLNSKRLQQELEYERGRRTTDRSRVEILIRQIEVAKVRQDLLLNAYADGAIAIEELTRNNRRFQEQLRVMEQELNDAEIKAQRARERVGKLETSEIITMWDKMSLQAQKRTLALFVSKIVVYPGKKDTNLIVIDWRE